MLSEGYHLFLLLFLVINLLGICGVIILINFKTYFKNSSLYFFSVLTIGILFPVVITSIAVTNFRTVNIIILLLAVYTLYLNFKKQERFFDKVSYNIIDMKTIIRLFIELNICVSVIFIFYWFLYSYNKHSFIGLPNSNFYFYSRVSSNLLNYNIETNTFNFSNSSYIAPYHYFDIWLNSFVSLFNKNSLNNYIFITIPLLASVCYFGFKTIISDIIITNKFLSVFLSAVGFILSGVYVNQIYDDNFIMNTSYVFSRNVINYQKLFPFYLFLLWLVYFLKNKKIEFLFISLGIICICYISSIIVISGFCFLFFLYCLVKQKRQLLFSLFSTLCVIFLIFCFYYFLSDKNELRLKQVQDFDAFFNLNKIRTGLNIFFKTNLQFIGLYFYLIIIFLINFKKNIALFLFYKFQFIVIVSFYFIALFSWIIFSHVIDSVQFFSNFAVPLLNIVALMFISYNLKTIKSYEAKLVFYIIISIVFFVNFKFTLNEIKPYNNYSEKSLKEFENKILPKLKNKKIVYFKSSKYLNNIFSKAGDFGIAAPHLLLLDNFEYVSLSVFDSQTSSTLYEKEIDQKQLKSSFFYKYVEIKNKIKNESIENLKTNFIIENRIQLIITTDEVVLPNNIKSLIIDSVFDKTSNENYYLLIH